MFAYNILDTITILKYIGIPMKVKVNIAFEINMTKEDLIEVLKKTVLLIVWSIRI